MYLALNFYIRWGWNVPNELERRLFLDQKELACQSSGSRYEAKHIFYSHIYIYIQLNIYYIYIFLHLDICFNMNLYVIIYYRSL